MAATNKSLWLQHQSQEALRLGYDASNYWDFTVGSGGDMTAAPTGGSAWTMSSALTVTGAVTASILKSGSTTGTLQLSGGSTEQLGANLVLHAETHASKPDQILVRHDTTTRATFDVDANTLAYTGTTVSTTGRLNLPTSGSAAGILFAGDTNLYRSAGNTLTTDDNFTVGGTLVTSTGLGNAIGTTALGLVGTRIGGSMTAGTGTAADGLRLTHVITVNDANTDSNHLHVGQSTGGSSMTTGGSGTAFSGAFVTAKFSEPDITLTGADTVTNAATVLIVNAPTEATYNAALLIMSGDLWLRDGRILFDDTSNTARHAWVNNVFHRNFTSDGSGTAFMTWLGGTLTGSSGDTSELSNVQVNGHIETQTAADTIGVASSLHVAEPQIVVNGSAAVTDAASLYISGVPSEGTYNNAILIADGDVWLRNGRLLLGTTGGMGNRDWIAHNFHYDFTTDGSGAGYMTWFGGDLTLSTGDTTAANVLINGHIDTQNLSEALGTLASLTIVEPIITKGTDTVATATTLWVSDAPTEGTNNYAILVSSGVTRLDGNLEVNGDLHMIASGGSSSPYRIIMDDAFPTFDNRGNVFHCDFTSDGSNTGCSGTWLGGYLTAVTGETDVQSTVYIRGFITTQDDGVTIGNVSSLLMNAPDITVGTDTVANASVIHISDAPSEGTDNWSIKIDEGNVSFGTGMIGQGSGVVPGDNIANRFQPAFSTNGTGSGYVHYFGGTLTGTSGDTGHLANVLVNGTVTTQSASQTIARVSSLYLVEPVIVNGTDTVTDASTLFILNAPSEGTNNYAILVEAGDVRFKGDLSLSGTSRLLLHTSEPDNVKNYIGGTYTSGGSGTSSWLTTLGGTITLADDDTFGGGVALVNGSVVTQNNNETLATVSGMTIVEPNITKGTDTVTRAATLYLSGVPTAGDDNYALLLAAGNIRMANNTKLIMRDNADSADVAALWLTTSDTLLLGNDTGVASVYVGAPGVGTTFGSTLTAFTSTASYASLSIPHGAAPTSPVNGDIWTTTAGIYVRINGSTVGPLS